MKWGTTPVLYDNHFRDDEVQRDEEGGDVTVDFILNNFNVFCGQRGEDLKLNIIAACDEINADLDKENT